jgi:ribosomal protein S18 acetylase RimI-like enzyme
MIRLFGMEDYEDVLRLWTKTGGIGLRTLDDSYEGIEKFVRRNPNTNFVAIEDNRIIGVILSGHDGRRGYIYHACVAEQYRKQSIGRTLVDKVIEAMKAEKITKVSLVCFADNKLGNYFWCSQGWNQRSDLNYYDKSINEMNI